MKRHVLTLVALLLLASLAITSCGVNSASAPMMGASVGGAEDIGYARQIIEGGGVPEAGWIVSEGLYSEHDIPTPPGECKDRLCLDFGYGYAPAIDSNREAVFVHLGMSSTIDPQTFKREHQQLALVVDRSGSMSSDGRLDAVKEALRRLAAKLDANDEVVLIQFDDDSQIIFGPTRVNDRDALLRAINTLETAGGTNIEGAMAKGYRELEKMQSRQGTAKRLMLFTDARPNVGATGADSFEEMTKRYAEKGIGLTAFGVGVDFGQDLIYQISQLRGGNFFFLGSQEKIKAVFDTEFDYLVTPLAYDLKLTVKTPAGMRLVAVYGLPTWKPGDVDAKLDIPTVFLSSKRGAIVLRYERTGGDHSIAIGDPLADGSLDYADPDGTPHTQHAMLKHTGNSVLSSGSRHFSHDGTRLAVALTNVYLGLRLGCELYKSDKTMAATIIQRAIDEVTAENRVLGNPGLAKEIELLGKLKVNVGK